MKARMRSRWALPSRVGALGAGDGRASTAPLRLTATVISVVSLRVGPTGTGIYQTAVKQRPFSRCLKGVKIRGVAIEARIASNNLPWRNHTSSPDPRSVCDRRERYG